MNKISFSDAIKFLKAATVGLSVVFLSLFVFASFKFGPSPVDASTQDITIQGGGTLPITHQKVSENLSNDGVFTVTYYFSEDQYRSTNTPKDVSFVVSNG